MQLDQVAADHGFDVSAPARHVTRAAAIFARDPGGELPAAAIEELTAALALLLRIEPSARHAAEDAIRAEFAIRLRLELGMDADDDDVGTAMRAGVRAVAASFGTSN